MKIKFEAELEEAIQFEVEIKETNLTTVLKNTPEIAPKNEIITELREA